jgi:hypothetical protein
MSDEEEGVDEALKAKYDKALDEQLAHLTRVTLAILEGHVSHLDGGLYAYVQDYWKRTGQADKIFAAYSRERVEMAVAKAWVRGATIDLNTHAHNAVVFPTWRKLQDRFDRLDRPLADHNEVKQVQADKDYARYQDVANMVLQEEPGLARAFDAGERGSTTKLAERVRERLGDDPPRVKTILRAITE